MSELSEWNVNEDGGTDTKQIMEEAKRIQKSYQTVEEDDQPQLETAWDDVSGAELDPKAVRQARREEIEYVRKMNLYTNKSEDVSTLNVPMSFCVCMSRNRG